MKDDRRDFIKKAASLAALSLGGINSAMAHSLASQLPVAHPPVTLPPVPAAQKGAAIRGVVRDAGMQMSEAYFAGPQEQKIALCRQMDVLGAVTGIGRGTEDTKPWEYPAVLAAKESWEILGLKLNVIEGPPALSEKTKLGLPGRDEEIANFITFMQSLSRTGIDVICYNWMPVIGWYRTNNAKPGRGGALVTAFDNEAIKDAPMTKYGPVSKEALWQNLEYFLKAVVPEAEKYGIKLAMHPDDPQVDEIRGISRIMTTVDNFKRMLAIYPSPNNGITMCQGNFSLMGADIPTVVRDFGKEKIHFVHFRNVRGGKFAFDECFHDEGQIDMYEAMKAYYDIGFKGPIRPDHVPTMAGDSNDHPGYSIIGCLYANGYIRGLMEAVSKSAAKIALLVALFLVSGLFANAQHVGSPPEYIKTLTAQWKGERFPDGRPKVPDDILERLKTISLEDVWGVLRNKGFQNQFEGNWIVLNTDSVMTGRVVTAQYMPSRPDLIDVIKAEGKDEGRGQQGGTNSWPIDILQPGDVYVADGYEKIADGTLIGDNLGNSIYAKSHRGVIFYGSVRDMAGLEEIKGFNAWIKGSDPSYIQQMMLTSINAPIRIGRAIVLPGDVVLANKYGTIFIPAYLAQEVVVTSEVTELRDEFGHQRLREGKYLTGQIDSKWSDDIKKDFLDWLNHYPGKLPMTKQELDDYLKERNY